MKIVSYTKIAMMAMTITFCSCNDLLDIEPSSSISPESYLREESQLNAFVLTKYPLISNNRVAEVGQDRGTDNEAGIYYSELFTDGDYKVGENGGSWNFTTIYDLNYFLNRVEPLFAAGQIDGSQVKIKHYIGEAHFLRAIEYFNKLKQLGDFPIITSTLTDNMDQLIAASKRMPRNQVARFILQDLKIAAEYMQPTAPDGNKNRLYADIANLMASRVALYEGTWLKYFKGTAFVPGTKDWPGATKDYNKDFKYEGGSIDSEINYFLSEAVRTSDLVASKYATSTLTENSGVIMQSSADKNAYVEMFSAIDMSSIQEILFWRAYNDAQGVRHNRPMDAAQSCYGYGITRGYLQAYVMSDGKPYYASAEYKGDNSIDEVLENRDDRIRLFLKRPGMINIWENVGQGTHGDVIEGEMPDILNGAQNKRHTTGYVSRKFWYWDHKITSGGKGVNGEHLFRVPEAYLNYMEAYYELNGSLDAKAISYWKALRKRAHINEDYTVTIAATNMAKEAELDWAAYSAGQVLTDKTLYNIRRERRCEFLGEGFRFDDLRRWRAMDQMMTNKYHIEGFKLWGGSYENKYTNLKFDKGKDSNVSSPTKSNYLRPYEIYEDNRAYNGYTWHLAHYLDPIAIEHFMITSGNKAEPYSDSPIYQNPYWGVKASVPAIK